MLYLLKNLPYYAFVKVAAIHHKLANGTLLCLLLVAIAGLRGASFTTT